MAIPTQSCTVTNCKTLIDEMALTNGGKHFLFDRWVAAYRAGTTTKCQAHYLDTDAPAAYAAYIKGDRHRGNRERD